MHSRARVDAALALHRCGVNACEISRRLEIPRSTVRDWVRDGGSPARTGARCPRCGAKPHDFGALPTEYAYLLGLYLGDGCLSSHARSVFRLRITLDAKYPGIVGECEAAVAAVMPRNRIGRYMRGGGARAEFTHLDVWCYSKSWPCLFPQHGPGPKHKRNIELTRWQLDHVTLHPHLLLRGLIHSDGCRFINTGTNWRHPRYVFSNASVDIHGIFKYGCDLLGLKYTDAPSTVYVSRKADVAVLDEFIGPKR